MELNDTRHKSCQMCNPCERKQYNSRKQSIRLHIRSILHCKQGRFNHIYQFVLQSKADLRYLFFAFLQFFIQSSCQYYHQQFVNSSSSIFHTICLLAHHQPWILVIGPSPSFCTINRSRHYISNTYFYYGAVNI